MLVVLILGLTFLTACAHTTQTASKSGPSLERILQKGELVVGTAAGMPPLIMKTRDGEIIGLEADIAKRIANDMGVKLRFEVMEFSKLLSALEQGKVDMILSYMTITQKRNLKVAFIGPYFISGKAFLTKIETIAAAGDPVEINGPNVRLTALRDSTSQAFVETFLPKVQFVPADSSDLAVRMVINDEVDALFADYPTCVVSLFRYPDRGLLSVITPLTYEPYGIAIPAGDPHLINWLENFLNNLEGSGQLEELTEHWFGSNFWLKKLP
jgi:polar amino acid transport system substrate-binding protein